MLVLAVLLAQGGHPAKSGPVVPPNVRCVADSFGNYTCSDGSRIVRDSFGNVVVPGAEVGCWVAEYGTMALCLLTNTRGH
jgi:hypothetical protein